MPKTAILDVEGTCVGVRPRTWADAFDDLDRNVGFREARGRTGEGGDRPMPPFLNKAGIEGRAGILKEGGPRRARMSAGARVLPEQAGADGKAAPHRTSLSCGGFADDGLREAGCVPSCPAPPALPVRYDRAPPAPLPAGR